VPDIPIDPAPVDPAALDPELLEPAAPALPLDPVVPVEPPVEDPPDAEAPDELPIDAFERMYSPPELLLDDDEPELLEPLELADELPPLPDCRHPVNVTFWPLRELLLPDVCPADVPDVPDVDPVAEPEDDPDVDPPAEPEDPPD
jgi:hypothetical protein